MRNPKEPRHIDEQVSDYATGFDRNAGNCISTSGGKLRVAAIGGS